MHVNNLAPTRLPEQIPTGSPQHAHVVCHHNTRTAPDHAHLNGWQSGPGEVHAPTGSGSWMKSTHRRACTS